MHAALKAVKPNSPSVEGGELVPMIIPAPGKKIGEVIDKSLTDVGHAMARGAVIINAQGKPIPAVRIPVRRSIRSKILYDIEVFDPGPQYDVCFDASTKTPPQLATLLKAT